MTGPVLGFDFGTTKIGVAVGQMVTRTANPLCIITARDGIPDWATLDSVISEWQPEAFVVGLPLNMDGTMSDMGEAASRFARRLSGRYNIPHNMVDERLSTFEAREQGSDDNLDAVAARLILETWLNCQQS